MKTLTPCEIETLEQIDTQFLKIDYVDERNIIIVIKISSLLLMLCDIHWYIYVRILLLDILLTHSYWVLYFRFGLSNRFDSEFPTALYAKVCIEIFYMHFELVLTRREEFEIKYIRCYWLQLMEKTNCGYCGFIDKNHIL